MLQRFWNSCFVAVCLDIGGEQSSIRSWLNGYGSSYNTVGTDFTSDNFIDAAFTAEEKAKIAQSNVPAHANPDYSTSPGSATTDKIFLLSITEAQYYFANDDNRKADATPYAVQKGALVKGSESGKITSDRTCTDAHFTSDWWLRSPGYYNDYAAFVRYDGSIFSYGDAVNLARFAVRPAFWMSL